MPEPKKYALKAEAGSYTLTGNPAALKAHAPLRGDHPVYSLVGQVASEFARAEHFLDVAIWALAGLDAPTGACITAQLIGVRPRCLSILALAEKRGLTEAALKEVRQFMNDSHKPSEQRNRLVHDSWYVEKTTGETSQLKSMPKDELMYGQKPVSEADCKKLYDSIHKFAKRAEELRGHLLAALAAKKASAGKR